MHEDIALNGCECMVGKIDIVFGVRLGGLGEWENVQQSRTVE